MYRHEPIQQLGLHLEQRGDRQRECNMELMGLPLSDIFNSKLMTWWPYLAPMATDEAGAGALGPADIPECACCGAHHAHVHAVVEDGTHNGPIQGQLLLHEHGARPGREQ